MTQFSRPDSPERRLIAAAQHQVVDRDTARAVGLTDHQVDQRLLTGFLTPDGQGSYRLAGSPRTGLTGQRAALARTRGLGIGLWSAVHHHRGNGLIAPPPPLIYVMVEWERRLKKTDWYQPYRTRRLEPDDLVTIAPGVQVATMARALRDLAAHLPHREWADRQLTRWTEETLIQRTLVLDDLGAMAERERCKRVRKRLKTLYEHQNGDDLRDFKSIAETWLRDLVKRRGLPEPEYNVVPPGGTKPVDAFWALVPLIAEFDGYQYHHTRTKHSRDRRGDRRTLRNGIPTVRITKDDFRSDLQQLEKDLVFLVTGRE